MVFTGAGLILRYALKSKCSKVSLCCGLLIIDRDIEAEERIEECKITHNIAVDNSANDSSSTLGNMLSI